MNKNIFKENTYQTSERKLIYVQTADNSSGNWPAYNGLEKVGDTSINGYEMDNRPNSNDLRQSANYRIKQYMGTAGVPYKIKWAELAYRQSDNHWFRDYDVHNVLIRSGIQRSTIGSGKEWFETDTLTIKKAIKAVKNGRKSLDNISSHNSVLKKIKLRPEQKEAVKKTKKVFNRKTNNKMLWNAKMRFGKTITALQLIKDMKYKHVLIITHRPIVDSGWFNDFKKMKMTDSGYKYGSKYEGEEFNNLFNSDVSYIYFASLQDLRGSKIIGGNVSDKNRNLFTTEWDLVIIDEAHEGTQTDLAKRVLDKVVNKEHTKLLELSGTPFNILDQYEENQVFNWDYVMEQNAKQNWTKQHPNEENPYSSLPKVSMYTFEMKNESNKSKFLDDENHSFNFREFFRTNDNGKFIYEDKVKQFLDNITSPDKKSNYPFSTKQFRNNLRHTLWILPGVQEANALEKLMLKHPVFGMEYKIVNVVRNGDENGITYDSDVEKVNDAIGNDPSSTKTITLTVRKMTTGVTIKPWTGVVFLSNTNSAMQYLQAAFRAQTPYSSSTFGIKTNCYIFDFAPDRALTVMSEATKLNTGVGKRTTGYQKDKMKQLMNFLPIIGETDQGMKKYKVDSLLSRIKYVYAQKAVRTGFEDNSLYNDELLMLDNVDLKDFNNLKAIVGTTKEEKKPIKIDVNSQGLTDEEYNISNQAEKKPKDKRTPQEQEKLDKKRKLKKQTKVMTSILRSISIRIPIMIYGMDVDFDENINIQSFVDNIDQKSWQEFMPKDVTKELFLKFSRYYDESVFIEAGKIIRKKLKQLDKVDIIERVEQISQLFSTFRNPDKETVLTPWRAINIQLGRTIGGYSFYDNNYEYQSIDGTNANHWVNTNYTNSIFNSKSRILEINSKTGLYPLYAATSFYYNNFIKNNPGKFDTKDELFIWKKILKENIFIIAKTPMAASITRRTLIGYHNIDVNIKFVNNIVNNIKNDIENEKIMIRRMFANMKFDVVIGNPPYQAKANGKSTRDEPIYYDFMNLAYKLSPLVILITPARFLFNTGQTPKSWNEKMLNDEHLKVVMYEKDSTNLFPNVVIKGGVAITLRDENKNFGKIGTYIPYKKLRSIVNKVNNGNKKSLSSLISPRGLFRFSHKFFKDYPGAKKNISKGTGNMIVSNSFENIKEAFKDKKGKSGQYLKFIGLLNKKRTFKYIDRKYVDTNPYIDGYKVALPKTNGNGNLGEKLSSPIICEPFDCSTDTFINIGPFYTKKESTALLKYIKTRFVRILLGVKKVTQDNPRGTWEKVPLENFSSSSDIDWSKSIVDIDKQLYKKYNLSNSEIDFIKNHSQEML
ncbi:restriction endonuclease [Apilactobacillus micheneri]|uniref:Eco57I restriction-modification methylase domain-containing protein n=1 Tax=Apilactobacillus micheneri TaxID=1899430 RepID=UPI0011263D18|nr:Eco57I restriction-modification methylase domain-containing protein [Apilactobacillus micheneri]TPR50453.1 restriction endonuclease [Apilactobacillus micheneri]